MIQDGNLISLQQKMKDSKRLEAKLQELENQRRIYDKEVISLKVEYQIEREDVEKLEVKSLANCFLNLIGKLDQKLEEERKEEYAAKMKLDAAKKQLEDIEQDIEKLQKELSKIRSAETEYQKAFEKKRVELRNSDTPAGEQILAIEEKIALIEAQKREVKEAISAGRSAEAIAERILSKLDDAAGWNTWDLVGGGGIITHMAKHGHLDEAQALVYELQNRLRKFKTELADIQISAGFQVNIDGFLKFADYFFDGIFADWTVGKRIDQSISAVRNTKGEIRKMISVLNNMEHSLERERVMLNTKLSDFITKF